MVESLFNIPSDLKDIIKDYVIFKPKNFDEIKKAVNLWCTHNHYALKKFGNIFNWDTSLITDMSLLFFFGNQGFDELDFDIDKIENISNIENMNEDDIEKLTNVLLFWNGADFNDDISNWNVSNVENMNRMFVECKKFNQPLDKWDVSNVKSMEEMFRGCKKFNQTLNSWNVSNVKNMECMFYGCENFDQLLNNWELSNLRFPCYMFKYCPISSINVHSFPKQFLDNEDYPYTETKNDDIDNSYNTITRDSYYENEDDEYSSTYTSYESTSSSSYSSEDER